jgi:glycosyltransferase involved in cell wall biosynthesis
MKLHWFSPLPPARSGIADCTAELLPFLAEKAEVVLWTDQPTWDDGLARYAEVRCYSDADVPGVRPDDPVVYQMGNSALFHASIWEVARRHPGLVVLHEPCLMHFFCGLLVDRQDTDGFVKLMAEHYGPSGWWAAQEVVCGRRSLGWASRLFPLFEPVVDRALGVVVHTGKAYRAVKRHGGCPVLQANLPCAPRFPAGAVRPVAPGPFRLVVFGHIGDNRCLPDLLRALAGLAERDRFVLDVYGQVAQPAPVHELIAQYALAGTVTLHNHVSDAVLDTALAAADLAVNLRYPTMGEASHSQLRIWDHALPSLVTRTGWYASLPDDAVVKVRPGSLLAEDLHQALAAFARAPERFRLMGLRGQAWLRARHDPGRYVDELLAFARRLGQDAQATWGDVVDRAEHLVAPWSGGAVRQMLRAAVRERVAGLAR